MKSLFIIYLHDLGTKSRFNSRIWPSKPVVLQRTCMILGLNLDSIFGSWSFKKGWHKCLQKLLIHDIKLILEILFFGPWSSKLPNFWIFLHDFEIESRFNFIIFIFQIPWFITYLHDLGTKSRFNFGILILQKNRMKQIYINASNLRCKINFENLIFRILILQTTWFTANLHDFGTKSRFNFGILILQISPNHLIYNLFAWSWN